MKNFTVYMLLNSETGDIYVGSTNNVKLRFAMHKSRYRGSEGGDSKLYRNMREHGWDNFRFVEVSTHKTREAMLKKESRLIRQMQPSLNTQGKSKIA